MGDLVNSLGEGIRWDKWDREYPSLRKSNNPRRKRYDDAGDRIDDDPDSGTDNVPVPQSAQRLVVLDRICPYSPDIRPDGRTYRTDIEGKHRNPLSRLVNTFSYEEQARAAQMAEYHGIAHDPAGEMRRMASAHRPKQWTDTLKPSIDSIATNPMDSYIDESLEDHETEWHVPQDRHWGVEVIFMRRKKEEAERRAREISESTEGGDTSASTEHLRKEDHTPVSERRTSSYGQSDGSHHSEKSTPPSSPSDSIPTKIKEWRPGPDNPPFPKGVSGLSSYSTPHRHRKSQSQSQSKSTPPGHSSASRPHATSTGEPKPISGPYHSYEIEPPLPLRSAPADPFHDRLMDEVADQGYPRPIRVLGPAGSVRYPFDLPPTYKPFTEEYVQRAWKASQYSGARGTERSGLTGGGTP